MLPFRGLNLTGRLLDFKKGSRWITVQANKISTITNKVELSFTENDKLTSTTTSTNSGYHGLPLKKANFKNSESYLTYFENKYPNLEFLNHNATTEHQIKFEFNETFNINLKQLEITYISTLFYFSISPKPHLNFKNVHIL